MQLTIALQTGIPKKQHFAFNWVCYAARPKLKRDLKWDQFFSCSQATPLRCRSLENQGFQADKDTGVARPQQISTATTTLLTAVVPVLLNLALPVAQKKVIQGIQYLFPSQKREGDLQFCLYVLLSPSHLFVSVAIHDHVSS